MKRAFLLALAAAMLLNLVGCGQTVEVIKCYYCGEKNDADANFCAHCGKAFVQGSVAVPTGTAGTAPTQGTQTPTAPENDSIAMQNSGAEGIYYGNNVCVDGEVIYLGYYGNLYVFCGSEVAVYSGGGTNTNTMAEMYLYNGYVYYANLNNHTIYRMSVADGKRDIVLSGVGEIKDSFIRDRYLYVYAVVDSKDHLHSVDLETMQTNTLFRESENAYEVKYLNQLDDNYLLFAEVAEKNWRLLMVDTKNATVREGFAAVSSGTLSGWYGWKNDEAYLYLCMRTWDDNEQFEYFYLKVDKQTYSVEESTEAEFDAAANLPLDDGLEWKYYLAWQNNLCREHKETGVQELLVKAGTGNREEGETVAKTYNIREIVYADDTRVIFKRYRMADGLEESVWQVDSDGNNLTELIRKEYHADAPEPYPVGSPSSSGSSGSTDSDSPAVGTKTCALCEGDGRITCYYCKGSGKGPIIYVMGIPTEQGCTYCGSSGWRVCSGCGGHGVR